MDDREKWRESESGKFVFAARHDDEMVLSIAVTLTIQLKHTVKKFQVLLFNTNDSIQHYTFICTLLNGSKYCYVSLTIQLEISHLFTHG